MVPSFGWGKRAALITETSSCIKNQKSFHFFVYWIFLWVATDLILPPKYIHSLRGPGELPGFKTHMAKGRSRRCLRIPFYSVFNHVSLNATGGASDIILPAYHGIWQNQIKKSVIINVIVTDD